MIIFYRIGTGDDRFESLKLFNIYRETIFWNYDKLNMDYNFGTNLFGMIIDNEYDKLFKILDELKVDEAITFKLKNLMNLGIVKGVDIDDEKEFICALDPKNEYMIRINSIEKVTEIKDQSKVLSYTQVKNILSKIENVTFIRNENCNSTGKIELMIYFNEWKEEVSIL